MPWYPQCCLTTKQRLFMTVLPLQMYRTLQTRNISRVAALLDAVGGAIHHIGNVHKYARREDVPEKTLFIITTDGMENASNFKIELLKRGKDCVLRTADIDYCI